MRDHNFRWLRFNILFRCFRFWSRRRRRRHRHHEGVKRKPWIDEKWDVLEYLSHHCKSMRVTGGEGNEIDVNEVKWSKIWVKSVKSWTSEFHCFHCLSIDIPSHKTCSLYTPVMYSVANFFLFLKPFRVVHTDHRKRKQAEKNSLEMN